MKENNLLSDRVFYLVYIHIIVILFEEPCKKIAKFDDLCHGSVSGERLEAIKEFVLSEM